MRWHCRRRSGRRTSLFNHQFNPSIAFALKRCREWRRRRYHDLARRTVTVTAHSVAFRTLLRVNTCRVLSPRGLRSGSHGKQERQHKWSRMMGPNSICHRSPPTVLGGRARFLCVKSRRTIRGPSQYFVNLPRTQLPAAYFRALRLTVIRARGASFASLMIGSFCCFISCRPESGESDFPDHHSQCLPRIR